MTPNERAQSVTAILKLSLGIELNAEDWEFIAGEIEGTIHSAVLAEREACATEADECRRTGNRACECAAAIRSRSEPAASVTTEKEARHG